MKDAYGVLKKKYILKMQDAFRRYGYSPRALTWSGAGRQNLRFFMLSRIGDMRNRSILEVGCGFADLYGYLLEQGWRGKYTGIDIVPEYLDVAREKYPGIDVRLLDLFEDELDGKFDYVFACGVFNEMIFDSADEQDAYVRKMIAKMFAVSMEGVGIDFQTSYVDFKHERGFHPPPEDIFGFCKNLSKRVAVRHDYMPYEYMVYIYKDDSIYRPKNVFSAYVDLLTEPDGEEPG